jgi:hypothetical protein
VHDPAGVHGGEGGVQELGHRLEALDGFVEAQAGGGEVKHEKSPQIES